jgi:hypothetical protein
MAPGQVSARCTRTPAWSTITSPPAGTGETPAKSVRPGGGYCSAADSRSAGMSQRAGTPAAKSARAVLASITREPCEASNSGRTPSGSRAPNSTRRSLSYSTKAYSPRR